VARQGEKMVLEAPPRKMEEFAAASSDVTASKKQQRN
jgi:hypothetical protein